MNAIIITLDNIIGNTCIQIWIYLSDKVVPTDQPRYNGLQFPSTVELSQSSINTAASATKRLTSWSLIQYENMVLPVQSIKLRRWDVPKIISSPKWDSSTGKMPSLYWNRQLLSGLYSTYQWIMFKDTFYSPPAAFYLCIDWLITRRLFDLPLHIYIIELGTFTDWCDLLKVSYVYLNQINTHLLCVGVC